MRPKGFSINSGLPFFQKSLEGFGVYEVFSKPVGNWSLVSGDLTFCGVLVVTRAWSLPNLTSALVTSMEV